MGAESSKPKQSNEIENSPMPIPLPVLTRQMILDLQRSNLKKNL